MIISTNNENALLSNFDLLKNQEINRELNFFDLLDSIENNIQVKKVNLDFDTLEVLFFKYELTFFCSGNNEDVFYLHQYLLGLCSMFYIKCYHDKIIFCFDDSISDFLKHNFKTKFEFRLIDI